MKSPRKKMVATLDKEFSLLVRAIARKEFNGICPFCGKRPIECCFHFVTRSKHIVRWDLTNAVGSCIPCNGKMEYDPHPFIKWYIDRYGLEAYDSLVLRSNKIAAFSMLELEQIRKRIADSMDDICR